MYTNPPDSEYNLSGNDPKRMNGGQFNSGYPPPPSGNFGMGYQNTGMPQGGYPYGGMPQGGTGYPQMGYPMPMMNYEQMMNYRQEMIRQQREYIIKRLEENYPVKYAIVHSTVLIIFGIVSIVLQILLIVGNGYMYDVGAGIIAGVIYIGLACLPLALSKFYHLEKSYSLINCFIF